MTLKSADCADGHIRRAVHFHRRQLGLAEAVPLVRQVGEIRVAGHGDGVLGREDAVQVVWTIADPEGLLEVVPGLQVGIAGAASSAVTYSPIVAA